MTVHSQLLINRRNNSFLRRFTPLFGVGVLGVAALTAANVSAIGQAFAANPATANLPQAAQLALSAIQPTLLVAVSSALGAVLVPRLGLRSHLAQVGVERGTRLPQELPLALALGTLASVLTIMFDVLTQSLLPPLKAGGAAVIETVSHTTLASVLAALLYGGFTEEILMRWGTLGLFAWCGYWLVQRQQGQPKAVLMWSAIGATALLFGAGHLPVTAMAYDLTPFVIARALLLNGLFGFVAGWLFWRRSLEAAISAHMSYHVVLTLVSLGLALLQPR